MSAYTHRGLVYFIACGQYVKIGYTAAPIEKRLSSLRRSITNGHSIICPEDFDRSKPLDVVRLIPGCVMRDERRLHAMFDRFRVAGEWFALEDDLVEQLAAMEYVTYSESLLHFRRARADLKRGSDLAVAA